MQLDLLSWTPPKPSRKRLKPQSSLEPEQSCRCGKNKGRGGVWRDGAGIDHVECQSCSTGPRMPYWRAPQTVYPGSLGELDAFEAIHAGGFA